MLLEVLLTCLHIAQEQKVCVWCTASNFENFHQIMELAVGVSNYHYRCLDMCDIALSCQQLLQTCRRGSRSAMEPLQRRTHHVHVPCIWMPAQ